jgi:hypothetical protein
VQRGARAGVVAAVTLLALAGSAAAAPAWVAPFEPLPAAATFMFPTMNAGGESLFADRIDLGAGKAAFRVASRAVDGTVSAPVVLPPAGSTTLSFTPSVALADDGHAIAAWADAGKAFYALRAPGGAWGAPASVVASNNVTSVVAGIDATGIATLGWAENTIPNPTLGDMNTASVKVVRITPGGSVSGSQTLLSPPPSSSAASVSVMKVAGTGPAVFAYGMFASLFLFFSETVAFRDSPTGSFGSAVDLPPSLVGLSGSAIGIGNSGRSAWAQTSGANIALRVRDPGGALGAATNIGAQDNASNVQLGIAGDGAITLAWDLQTASDPRILACTATPTDCVGDPQRLSPPTPSLSLSSMAVNAAGAALVAWNSTTFTPTVVRRAEAALRPAGATAFDPAQDVAPSPAQGPAVALDAAGDGVATFDGGASPAHAFKAAGLDANGPRIDAFAAPSPLLQGATAQFSASASDLWSPFGLAWSFGDGATVAGSPVAHTFAAAGSFFVTVTATDAAGNSSSRSATVVVRDTVAPSIRSLTIGSRRFRVGAKPTAVSAAAKRRGKRGGTPLGTTIRYALSEAATARFQIDRVSAGRRVGRACRKPTRANRGRRACSRYTRVGVLTRRAGKGANTLAFSGRIGRKALAPGSYRLTLTARDAAGNASRPRTLTFAIVRR